MVHYVTRFDAIIDQIRLKSKQILTKFLTFKPKIFDIRDLNSWNLFYRIYL